MWEADPREKWYRTQLESGKSKPREEDDKMRWVNEGQQGRDFIKLLRW